MAWGIATTGLAAQPDLTDPNQKINYALGLDMVSTFQKQEFDLDMSSFLAGMADSLAGKPALTPDQKAAALKEMQAYVQAKSMVRLKELAATNLQAGTAFLAANAQKEGVQVKTVTAPDGSPTELQYKILQSGPPGASPQSNDIVEVHYEGHLIDGTLFDSSVKRGTPATFGLNNVMPGWRAALSMMRAGDKWQLCLPPKLAFGEFGGTRVGPNCTIVCELELLSFYTPKPVPAKP